MRAAGKLHGKLLILHGAIDDNVSLRNTMRLVQALQDANKDFELMIYPSSRHGIFGAALQQDPARLHPPDPAATPNRKNRYRRVRLRQAWWRSQLAQFLSAAAGALRDSTSAPPRPVRKCRYDLTRQATTWCHHRRHTEAAG